MNAFTNAISFLTAHENGLDAGNIKFTRTYERELRLARRAVCVAVGVGDNSLAAEVLAALPYDGRETPESLKGHLSVFGLA